MKYNVLNMTTIYAILIAWASLMITACPEPDKATANKQSTKPIKTTPETPTETTTFTVEFNTNDGTPIADKTIANGSKVTPPPPHKNRLYL